MTVSSVEAARRETPEALFAFDNTYVNLPDIFRAEVEPTPVRAPKLVRFNTALAAELGLDAGRFDPETAAAVFSGNRVPEGAQPIAMAYAAHQFGTFVPQLGDGRAILLGEVTGRDGRRRDIQLKGAGPTPFSRRGDGRAALGPVLREYVVSEAMHALGIPATRALAAVTTGEPVYRETVLPGAVLTRVAASHIRIGTFQYLAVRGDHAALRRLAAYALERHYPERESAGNPALALLEAVIERQAALIARWMQVGFIHGVMNTDNMAISGETIDFGPCAFMDAYAPQKVFSSIDQGGRYGYGNQPGIAQWNLARFAETLLPILDPDTEKAVDLANAAIAGFAGTFQPLWLSGMGAKIGLSQTREDDLPLIQDFLKLMHEGRADFTLAFRRLSDAALDERGEVNLRALFENAAALGDWLQRWRLRLAADPATPEVRAAAMRAVNPALIPRNHRIEEMIEAAVERGDFAPFETLLEALARPYDDDPRFAAYAAAPAPQEEVFQTFCGT